MPGHMLSPTLSGERQVCRKVTPVSGHIPQKVESSVDRQLSGGRSPAVCPSCRTERTARGETQG